MCHEKEKSSLWCKTNIWFSKQVASKLSGPNLGPNKNNLLTCMRACACGETKLCRKPCLDSSR